MFNAVFIDETYGAACRSHEASLARFSLFVLHRFAYTVGMEYQIGDIKTAAELHFDREWDEVPTKNFKLMKCFIPTVCVFDGRHSISNLAWVAVEDQS